MSVKKLTRKNLLRLADFTAPELESILDRAQELKRMWKEGKSYFPLTGKTLGLIFEHSSTRTRVAFEVGVSQLGGTAIFLSAKDSQIGRGESMADTARVLSRYVNALAARLDQQKDLEELARFATIPVINALTQECHPCQILADLLTIRESLGDVNQKKILYIGDGNNVSNSWVEAAKVLGFRLAVCTPVALKPNFENILGSKTLPANISWTDDPQAGFRDAHVISTDVWVSMGAEGSEEKKNQLRPYQVNKDMMRFADSKAIILHCLPAHRGEEITAEVMEGRFSRIFDQAENKLHVQKSVLDLLMTGS